MSDAKDHDLDSGPSERAVAVARAWLVILGILWGACGTGIAVTADGVDQLWGGTMVAFGMAHFVAARYASGKVALVFALIGP